jgi:hypothetical protein
MDRDSLLFELNVIVVPGYHVAVCKLCRYGLASDVIFADHIRNEHEKKHFSREALRAMFENQLQCRRMSEVIIPADLVPAFPQLPVFQGFACSSEGCNYAAVKKDTILRHCRTIHGDNTLFHAHTVQRYLSARYPLVLSSV